MTSDKYVAALVVLWVGVVLSGRLVAQAPDAEAEPPVDSTLEERVEVSIMEVSLVALDRQRDAGSRPRGRRAGRHDRRQAA